MKVIVIGGVAAGTKTAAKIKREDPFADVTLLTQSAHISYATCGLPYYVGDVIHDQQSLVVHTPEDFTGLTGVQVKTLTEVTSVHRETKTVCAKSVQTGEEKEYSYDQLVIATGARSVAPDIEGVNLPGVYQMHTLEDAVAVREAVDAGKAKRAVIVGGGFVGLEMAVNLAARDVRVSVVEEADQILPGFDVEMAGFIENHLADHDIMVFTNTKVAAILGTDHVEKVKTGRRAMKADMVILATGDVPNTEFLKDSGIELLPNGTIKTDEHLRTNDEHIYAAGDCISVKNRITGEDVWAPMGSLANVEGRIVGSNVCGGQESFPGTLGTSIIELPELNAAYSGLSEAEARQKGYEVVSALCVIDDKANFLPGFSNLIIKLIADQATDQFLGLQVLGKGEVDKIVDIGAMALSMKAKVSDLKHLDLAYAPAFSTAIHPFSVAVNVLCNKMSGKLDSLTPAQYLDGEAEGWQVIDLSKRPMIPSGTYVELKSVKAGYDALSKSEPLLLVCTRGRRAFQAQTQLKASGYENTKVLEGGLAMNQVNEEEEED